MSDPYLTGEKYCEVYDEPRHQFHVRNAFTNIYEIQLPPDNKTHFHRHCEDTVYFVITDVDVEESFQNKPTIQTVAPCGGTMSRAHRTESLIHQVKNVGPGTMHMVGAEALERPPVRAAQPIAHRDHTMSWESNRFRVYEVNAQTFAQPTDYAVYGLLVTFKSTTATISASKTQGSATIKLAPGGFIWIEPSTQISFNEAFRGIFAEWI
jgi:hypothetical protein